MYTDFEIIKIFRNCRNIREIMKAAMIFTYLWREGLRYDLSFIQKTASSKINQLEDDGN